MPSFYVAQFESDETVEIIPAAWLEEREDGKYSFWPDTGDQKKIVMYMIKNITPKESWTKSKIKRIFAEANTYSDALTKLKISKTHSDVEEEYQKINNKSLRAQRKKKLIDSESDTEEEEKKLKKFKMNVESFPAPPVKNSSSSTEAEARAEKIVQPNFEIIQKKGDSAEEEDLNDDVYREDSELKTRDNRQVKK